MKIHKDTLERYTEDTQKDTQQTPEDTLERYTLKENKIHRRYTEKIHFIGKNTSRLFPVEKKCDLELRKTQFNRFNRTSGDIGNKIM